MTVPTDGAAQPSMGPADGEPDLTALLGSRICHDLASPVGAIRNGLELMAMTGTPSAEMALVSSSVESALARIEFFRLAFGSGDPDAPIPSAMAAQTAVKLYEGGRTAIDWQDGVDRPRWELRLAYLAILCVDAAAPMGGTLSVGHDGTWRVRIDAPRVRELPFWDAVNRQEVPGDLVGDFVQFGLLVDDARRRGRIVAAEVADDAVTITV